MINSLYQQILEVRFVYVILELDKGRLVLYALFLIPTQISPIGLWLVFGLCWQVKYLFPLCQTYTFVR